MAHLATTLTRDAYTVIATEGETVNVQLPVPPFRSQNADKELS